MGCNIRDKSIRPRHRSRHSTKPPPSSFPALSPFASPAGPNPTVDLDLDLNLTPNPNPTPTIDDAGWGYCTEDQLEDLLLRNLDFIYKEALARLVSLGYDESLALHAILSNGHCYGSMDVLSNILHNAIAYLKGPPPSTSPFCDLRRLQEYALAGMVCLLQQARHNLSRGDAMWCLLMSDLHVGRASTIEIPSLSGDFHPRLCRRGGNPFPKRSVAKFSTTEEGAVAKEVQDPDIVASVMRSLESMSIAEEKMAPEAGTGDDQKKEMIFDMIRQIQDLEGQVKERQEWAQQKALQAARKLSSDLAELKALRAECEENQQGKKGKQVLEDSTMKRLSEMEATLKRANGQVDRANVAVLRLEIENAEIRAEMEASKLSASESARTCQEIAKREKKRRKRLLAWEKQKVKLQEEIAEETRMIAQMQQQLTDVEKSQKEIEIQWKQEIKVKDQAISQVEEERRAKEAADAAIKRKHEALRQKIELDFQRHKDDIRRLEEELSRLKATSIRSTQPTNPISNSLGSVKEANPRTLKGFNKQRNRECIICTQDEVSVVFLPCAHQVLCLRCNEEHEKSAKPRRCPCCNAQIEQRIRVYGTSSS